ncbi:Do family serine endopeptidase [Fulvivirga sp. 29W222]|uniref:Do family serine endopeptidase n=1 Tax=Fulvivirga marina TaxID=2494733 RepID=A0A937G025_9BACT|nr:Do family serine endopeptidase [Fulvivirga marina]MBL6448078.1 Do family serine endopeptidase [Fulvivirga marina]
MNLKPISLLVVSSLLLIACQAQERENTKRDIGTLQSKYGVTASNISYTGTVDFRHAARVATPGVVHIRSTYTVDGQENGKNFYGIPDPLRDLLRNDPFFKQFDFQFPERKYKVVPRQTAGSGVILSSDGYIVTNNHVIEGADEIEVTLYDRHSYKGKVIGTDSQTDLALVRIDANELSYITFGNSDSVEVGQWVLAVGNPFNLASTVTAGIVSAKARNINILQDQNAIESFIQTDAAVNPGNSGGALVSLDGKLIGINTAIATPTGVYAGYAFAIPSDIVKKVVDDLMNFGKVQRAVLGVIISDLNSELSDELNIKRTTGVYVNNVLEGEAAQKAGIRKKDVIIAIDDMATDSSPELQEIIARKKPGEKVKITLIRNGKELKLYATLESPKEKTIAAGAGKALLKELGVELQEISNEDKQKYSIKNGVIVTRLYAGKLSEYTDIKEGFIITSVNNIPIKSVDDFISAVGSQQGGIMLEGIYPGDPTIYYYAFGMQGSSG